MRKLEIKIKKRSFNSIKIALICFEAFIRKKNQWESIIEMQTLHNI